MREWTKQVAGMSRDYSRTRVITCSSRCQTQTHTHTLACQKKTTSQSTNQPTDHPPTHPTNQPTPIIPDGVRHGSSILTELAGAQHCYILCVLMWCVLCGGGGHGEG